MTGFGEARCERDGLVVAIELRTVNNKAFKLSLRSSDRYLALEPQVEAVVRRRMRRGTVMIDVHVARETGDDAFQINAAVLLGYRRQIAALQAELNLVEPIPLEPLLVLPGVVEENVRARGDLERDWPAIEQALGEALDHLDQMRRSEGQAMTDDLQANCRTIAENLAAIDRRGPVVQENYRGRLLERVNKILTEHQITVEPADVIRELGIFSERSDISEECVRLRSHLEQFAAAMDLSESSGRKLEFITQEMFRETNTIGSKANDTEISHHVVEIKTAIERLREMVQNVE